MIGKYIAKIGTDNIVEQVICVKSRIIRNQDGTINQSKVDEIGQAHLGAGTYVGWVDEGTEYDKPSAGQVYDNSLKKFHDPRPIDRNGNACTSWTINSSTMVWQAPHSCDPHNRKRVEWDEAEQKWYSHPAGNVADALATWNTSTNAWEEV